MPQEIEKKYIIKDIPEHLENFAKEEIIQGYYNDTHGKSQRLRKIITIKNGKKTTKYYLTHKKGHGLIRREDEKIISEQTFKTQWKQVNNTYLEKTRYKIPYKDFTIELDQYHNKLNGLRTAEVEFSSIQESENFEQPDRFSTNITEYKEASNKYLAAHGMDNLVSKTKIKTHIIKQQLRNFYNNEATKYTQTRKKKRSDAETIINTINNINKSELTILEVGCGSGRLLEHLTTIQHKKIQYIGVDLSSELLKQAQKIALPKNISTTFVCKDMITYLASQQQESFDIIIGIASIQHLPSIQERFLCMKYIYRLLRYEGLCIMTNRSFSHRFIKTYRKSIRNAAKKYAISRGKSKRNDLLLPRKGEQELFYRFYHIFTKKEIYELSIRSGFIIKKLCYLDKQGNQTDKRENANNTLLIGEKSVFE